MANNLVALGSDAAACLDCLIELHLLGIEGVFFLNDVFVLVALGVFQQMPDNTTAIQP
jgi:hypothetical protein